MKKTGLLFSLILFCFTAVYPQSGNDTLLLRLKGDTLNTGQCLSPELSFKDLEYDNRELKTGNIILQLRNGELIDEMSIEDFKKFDTGLWLLYNGSFQNKDSLIIRIPFSDRVREASFCLEPEKISRSRGALTRHKGYVKLPVFFATDRNYDKSAPIDERFGGQRSRLRYGICEISIPNTHKSGVIEEPSLWKLEFEEDPKEHIMIHRTSVLNKEKFLSGLNEALKNSNKKTSLLFVHGYNVSFAEAAKRTAQISYDLLFEGVPLFYSWPSRASLSGYTNDEANIEWAKANIKTFLKFYLSEAETKEVYLIAHSMGNRGLTAALVELLSENPELKEKIQEVILAAPDIDADIFKRDIAPKMAELTRNPVTLYVSANDVALKASKLVHGYSRAGDVNDGLILLNGFETVDASGIDTGFLGHSYFADSHSLISDIFNLIKTGRRAENRNNLSELMTDLKTYWKIKSN